MPASSRTTITNPYSVPVRESMHLTAYVPSIVHRYFMHDLLCHTPGAMNAILCTIINRVHEELLDRGVTKWDEESEAIINHILKNITFND